MSVQVLWLQAERIGEHVHVEISMGTQYGQDDCPTGRYGAADSGRGWRNDAGRAGKITLHKEEWLSFVQAAAVGGKATGLRVCWLETTDDRRWLWNGGPGGEPCIFGRHEPVPWVRDGATDA